MNNKLIQQTQFMPFREALAYLELGGFFEGEVGQYIHLVLNSVLELTSRSNPGVLSEPGGQIIGVIGVPASGEGFALVMEAFSQLTAAKFVGKYHEEGHAESENDIRLSFNLQYEEIVEAASLIKLMRG